MKEVKTQQLAVSAGVRRLVAVVVAICGVWAGRGEGATNYDTSWTYSYDGGSSTDIIYDVKSLPNGASICAGQMVDTTTGRANVLLLKLDAAGRLVWKKQYTVNSTQNTSYNNQHARSLAIAANGDYIIGGVRFISPLIMRTDSSGNLKWATWVYDSTNNRQSLLLQAAKVNCVRETSRGTIICAAGAHFTDVGYVYGSSASNYAAYLELNPTTGQIAHWGNWGAIAGYYLGGFGIEETRTGNYIMAGNQALLYMDTIGNLIWERNYTFTLTGVGSEINNIVRCKPTSDDRLIVAGMAYEGNCWTNFSKLYYDAWWSPIAYAYGTNSTWDTAGYQGGNDRINDFTQLIDNNLVFIGKKYITASTAGIWVYVTSSTTNQIYWEAEIAGSLNGGEPYSVCATPDSGFTVVGKRGGNAFAAHFIPKPPVEAALPPQTAPNITPRFIARMQGSRLIVAGIAGCPGAGNVVLFDIAGNLLATKPIAAGATNTASLDVSRLMRGTHVVKVTIGNAVRTVAVTVGR